jgi:A/G-specific adenine glycosylase
MIVVEEYGGEIPRDLTLLRKLPGIGPYTAGAIASMAFGLDSPVLDGNLRRVYSRVFNVSEPADSSGGEKILWGLAEKHMPKGSAGDYNQALMDLGSIICLPRNPGCPLCPLKGICIALSLGLQEQRPVMKPKLKVPHYVVTAAVIMRNTKILLAKRPSKGLLGGMWEFPGGKVEKGESLEDCLVREIREELGVGIRIGEPIGIYKHAYTHFRITLHAFMCELNDIEPHPDDNPGLAWVFPAEMDEYPMGKVDRQIARRLQLAK